MRSRLGKVDRESRYVVVGLILWTLFHAYWMLTENINWDEFALLARARETVLSGVLHTGGRPGLGTLALVPLVRECGDVIAAVRWARFAWIGFGLSILIGFWFLLRKVLPGRDRSDVSDRLLGLSLLGLTPAFLRYSIQVRTDQPAIALGLFGSVALVTSRNRTILALLAGVLFGTGFLFSQKLAYVAALGGLLAIGDTLRYGRPDLRRDLGRVGLTLAGAIGTLVVYHMIMAASFGDVPPPVSRGYLSAFEFYRMSDEYQYYRRMAPGLLPHILLSLFVIAGLHRAPRPILALNCKPRSPGSRRCRPRNCGWRVPRGGHTLFLDGTWALSRNRARTGVAHCAPGLSIGTDTASVNGYSVESAAVDRRSDGHRSFSGLTTSAAGGPGLRRSKHVRRSFRIPSRESAALSR